MELPQGWHLATPDTPVLLLAHHAELRLLRVAVPREAMPGTYRLRYTALDASSGAALASDSLLVAVQAVHRLSLQLLDAPEMVVAGQSYRASFVVRNGGNVTSRIGFRVASAYGWPAALDSAVVTLAPGRARAVSVTVRTNRAESRQRRHRLDVVARASADTAVTATAFSLVDVIPHSGSGAPRFHALPLELTVRATEPGDAVSGELRGSGTLTEGGNDQIDVLLRGPDRGLGLFGEQDEYRATLTGDRYQLRLGDQNPTLSPLTQAGRSGFGGSGRLTLGPLTAGGFMLQDRRTYAYTHEIQRAGFLETRIAGQSRLGVNYLQRQGFDAGELWTAHGVLAPSPAATLDVEYGAGTSAAGRGAARSVQLAGTTRFASYSAQYRDADRTFPGIVRGLVYEDGELALHPFGRLTLAGRFIDRTTSLPYLPGISGDQHYRSVRGSVAYGRYLSAEFRRSWRDDSLILAPFAGSEDAVRIQSGVDAGPLGLFAAAELGRVRFGPDPTRHPFQQLFAQARLRPGAHGSLSIAVERHHGSTLLTPWPLDWLSAQLYAAVQLGGTGLRLGANARRYDGAPTRTYGVIDAEWDQKLLFGHRLTARARVMSFGGTPLPEESFVRIGYTIPLALPIGASRHSARVAGRIVDATSGRPIPNALVRLGDHAQLSDRSGRFVFSGLAPDTYYVHVDRHNLAAGQITVGEDPLPVRVGTLQTRHIEVGLVRGAQLTGAVRISTIAARRIAGAPKDELADSAAIPNVIVSLTGDSGATLRRITDEQGRFAFSGVRPGRWTLRIPAEALPAHFRLQRDSLVFNVAPGDTLHAVLRVVPEHRTLHIVVTADLTADKRSVLVERPAFTHSYTVTPWDIGLMQIARYMYGDASLWPKIWVANRFHLSDPNTIRPGQTLIVPDKAPLTPEEITARDEYRQRQASAHHGPGIAWRLPAAWHSYTVTRWDISLMQIARYMYDDASLWPKIWVANRSQLPDPDKIYPGQTLVVPDKAPLTPQEIAARDAYFARQRR